MSGRQEHSAGGVVIRGSAGAYQLALIRPRGRAVWTLPKGHMNPGESPQAAAEREVREETGLAVALVEPLGVIRYHYRFRGRLISKLVDFFLFRHVSGVIDQLDEAMRAEVDVAQWVDLSQASAMLTHRGDKEMVDLAAAKLANGPKGLADDSDESVASS